MKFNLIFMFLILTCSCAFADPIETYCPDPVEIKNNNLYGWLPLYKDGEELASTQDVKKFKQHLLVFLQARWDVQYLETAHCFYVGNDPIVDKIILARDAWRPLPEENWIWLSDKAAECRKIGGKKCGFVSS